MAVPFDGRLAFLGEEAVEQRRNVLFLRIHLWGHAEILGALFEAYDRLLEGLSTDMEAKLETDDALDAKRKQTIEPVWQPGSGLGPWGGQPRRVFADPV